MQREASLDKRSDSLDDRENDLKKRSDLMERKQEDTARLHDEAEALVTKQNTELERIASMTQDEAKQIIIDRVQKEAFHDAAASVRDIEARAKEEAEKKARNIIALAIQKCASDHVAESTVSVIALPNDDMKCRIIGREGATSARWKLRRAWTSSSTIRPKPSSCPRLTRFAVKSPA